MYRRLGHAIRRQLAACVSKHQCDTTAVLSCCSDIEYMERTALLLERRPQARDLLGGLRRAVVAALCRRARRRQLLPQALQALLILLCLRLRLCKLLPQRLCLRACGCELGLELRSGRGGALCIGAACRQLRLRIQLCLLRSSELLLQAR